MGTACICIGTISVCMCTLIIRLQPEQGNTLITATTIIDLNQFILPGVKVVSQAGGASVFEIALGRYIWKCLCFDSLHAPQRSQSEPDANWDYIR